MKRYKYDHTHYLASVGQMGCLQTLSATPVVAGDSISINTTASLRLSPLRRALVLDSKCDIFTFFVPYRHLLPDIWEQAVKNGIADDTFLNTTSGPGDDISGYVPAHQYEGEDRSELLYMAYAKIWNNYFRIPNIDADDVLDETGDRISGTFRDFGQPIARLPSFLTTGSALEVDDLIYQVEAAEDSVSLIDIQSAMALLKNDVDRTYFAHRYKDLIADGFGVGTVNTDADERPTLLYQQTSWLSGYDVDGTDDATLGQYAGKAQGMASFNQPAKRFKEHGVLMQMCALRFPPIFNNEAIPQFSVAGIKTPLYEALSGDPRYVGMKKPEQIAVSDTLYSPGGNGNNGFMPYYQSFRTHPNMIHFKYQGQPGYPFIDFSDIGNVKEARNFGYEHPGQYEDMFVGQELGHWQMIGRNDQTAFRVIPDAASSLYAGSD